MFFTDNLLVDNTLTLIAFEGHFVMTGSVYWHTSNCIKVLKRQVDKNKCNNGSIGGFLDREGGKSKKHFYSVHVVWSKFNFISSSKHTPNSS